MDGIFMEAIARKHTRKRGGCLQCSCAGRDAGLYSWSNCFFAAPSSLRWSFADLGILKIQGGRRPQWRPRPRRTCHTIVVGRYVNTAIPPWRCVGCNSPRRPSCIRPSGPARRCPPAKISRFCRDDRAGRGNPFALFVLRDIEEEFADDRPVAREIALERADVLSAHPDVLGHKLAGEPLRVEGCALCTRTTRSPRNNAAVENADVAAVQNTACSARGNRGPILSEGLLNR